MHFHFTARLISKLAFQSLAIIKKPIHRNRCQEELNDFPLGELEETTGTPLYYVDEDYPSKT